MNTLETVQNYLEAIYILSLKSSTVRAIDVCNYLDFKRSTVSVALGKLKDEDYLYIEDNLIHLTPKGLKEAKRMYERHELIARIFMDLGVDEETAYHDSCMVEHDLSDKTFKAIKAYYQKRKTIH